MKRQTEEFRRTLVQRVLSNPDKPVKNIAQEAGVGYSTLQKWVARYRQTASETGGEEAKASMAEARRPQDWSHIDRFNAILATNSMDEEEIGRYCREQGLYRQQLKKWKDDLMTEPDKSKLQKLQDENRTLKSKSKKLEKELWRKEKALAEASTLLILKKKADSIWGEVEDDI